MSAEDPKKSFSDLSARLHKARQAHPDLKNRAPQLKAENSGFGQALRIGVDMMSALVVGTGLGWFLDNWLGTRPWLMIVFIFLGGGAGILNVYRTAMQMAEDCENEMQNHKNSDEKSPDSGIFTPKDEEK